MFFKMRKSRTRRMLDWMSMLFSSLRKWFKKARS